VRTVCCARGGGRFAAPPTAVDCVRPGGKPAGAQNGAVHTKRGPLRCQKLGLFYEKRVEGSGRRARPRKLHRAVADSWERAWHTRAARRGPSARTGGRARRADPPAVRVLTCVWRQGRTPAGRAARPLKPRKNFTARRRRVARTRCPRERRGGGRERGVRRRGTVRAAPAGVPSVSRGTVLET
jgi:hypothetical protein